MRSTQVDGISAEMDHLTGIGPFSTILLPYWRKHLWRKMNRMEVVENGKMLAHPQEYTIANSRQEESESLARADAPENRKMQGRILAPAGRTGRSASRYRREDTGKEAHP